MSAKRAQEFSPVEYLQEAELGTCRLHPALQCFACLGQTLRVSRVSLGVNEFADAAS